MPRRNARARPKSQRSKRPSHIKHTTPLALAETLAAILRKPYTEPQQGAYAIGPFIVLASRKYMFPIVLHAGQRVTIGRAVRLARLAFSVERTAPYVPTVRHRDE